MEEGRVPNKNSKDLQALSKLLDESINLPFGIKVGWDGILGLIPGVGDYVTSILSFYIIFRSAQMGAGLSSIIRMILNVLIDVLLGQIPMLGDIFDFAWKANKKNIKILDEIHDDPSLAERGSKTVLGIVILLLGMSFLGILAFGVWLGSLVFELF